jgi:cytochrome c biogenesis protein CcmG, thiol:disulfide interchange protein DsbE
MNEHLADSKRITNPAARRLLFLLPILLFAALAAYFLLRLNENRDPSEIPSALIDRPVPEFALPGMSSDTKGVARADLMRAGSEGKVVIVNFFASWCLPCRAEHPLLSELAKHPNVMLYGILYKDEPAAATDWLNELGNPYSAIGVDAKGRTGIDFGISGVPESFIIDRAGHIRFRQWGPLDQPAIDKTIMPLLDELTK